MAPVPALRLGQPVIIDNRPGAIGTIGSLAAARSPADGPALIHGTEDSHAIAPHLLKPMSHDARYPPRDIAARLHAAIESALADAQVIESMRRMSMVTTPMMAYAYQPFQVREYARWASSILSANLALS